MYVKGHLKVLLYQRSSMHTKTAILKIFVLNFVKHRVFSATPRNPLFPPSTLKLYFHITSSDV